MPEDASSREWVINVTDSGVGDLRPGVKLKLSAFPAFDGSDDYEQKPYLTGEGEIYAIEPNPEQAGKIVRIKNITWSEREEL